MTTTVLGRHPKAYLIEVNYWARKLGATDCTVHYDASVTLTCPDGYICHNYSPSAKELRR